jgi:hypothetical protein
MQWILWPYTHTWKSVFSIFSSVQEQAVSHVQVYRVLFTAVFRNDGSSHGFSFKKEILTL